MPEYTYKCSKCELAIDKTFTIREMETTVVFCRCGSKMNKVIHAPQLMGFDRLGRSGRQE